MKKGKFLLSVIFALFFGLYSLIFYSHNNIKFILGKNQINELRIDEFCR